MSKKPQTWTTFLIAHMLNNTFEHQIKDQSIKGYSKNLIHLNFELVKIEKVNRSLYR